MKFLMTVIVFSFWIRDLWIYLNVISRVIMLFIESNIVFCVRNVSQNMVIIQFLNASTQFIWSTLQQNIQISHLFVKITRINISEYPIAWHSYIWLILAYHLAWGQGNHKRFFFTYNDPRSYYSSSAFINQKNWFSGRNRFVSSNSTSPFQFLMFVSQTIFHTQFCVR